MSVIVTRAGKGATLSWDEADANFTNLNNDKLETSTAATTYTTKVDPATSGTLTHSGDVVLSGTLTHSGDIVIGGTGKRITGDFSNAVVVNRVMFKSATTNGLTLVGAIPDGSGQTASFDVYNSSDPNNSSYLRCISSATEMSIRSSQSGTGGFLPLTLHAGGAERVRIDTAGNINIPTLGARITGDFSNATATNRVMFQTSTPDQNTSLSIIPNGASTAASLLLENSSAPANNSFAQLTLDSDTVSFRSGIRGSGSYLPMTFFTGGAERLRITDAGDVLVTSSGRLGYGPGAGGTVTQATNKNTAVTLNKPSGRITTHNATMNSDTSAVFTVNNSLVTAADTVIVTGVAGVSNYEIVVKTVNNGNFVIFIRNLTGQAQAEAIPINFAIIKGAAS